MLNIVNPGSSYHKGYISVTKITSQILTPDFSVGKYCCSIVFFSKLSLLVIVYWVECAHVKALFEYVQSGILIHNSSFAKKNNSICHIHDVLIHSIALSEQTLA